MSINPLNNISKVYLEQIAAEAFVDPEQGEAPSGRSPLQNVSDHPSPLVRKRAVKAFKSQMGKEYGGTWKSRTKDPVAEAVDQDSDGDNDFADVRIARMIASGVPKEVAIQKTKNKPYNKKSTKVAKEAKFYDPMEDPDFDPHEAEKSRGVSGKNNPKGGKALGKKKPVKEGYSDWRQDLAEVIDGKLPDEKIKEKKIQNKIKTSAVGGGIQMSEAIENLGGTLLKMVEVEEIDEAQQSFPFKKVEAQKEKARKGSVYGKDTGNKPVPQVTDAEKKATTRFSKMQRTYEKEKRAKQEADKARRSSTFYKDTHPASTPKMKKANEEFQLDEKTLTSAETKKKEELVKSMKKRAGDFEKRYPGRGKEVMYATATKMAKKMAEDIAIGGPSLTPTPTSAKPNPQQQRLAQQSKKQKQQEIGILQRKISALRSAPSGVDTNITA